VIRICFCAVRPRWRHEVRAGPARPEAEGRIWQPGGALSSENWGTAEEVLTVSGSLSATGGRLRSPGRPGAVAVFRTIHFACSPPCGEALRADPSFLRLPGLRH